MGVWLKNEVRYEEYLHNYWKDGNVVPFATWRAQKRWIQRDFKGRRDFVCWMRDRQKRRKWHLKPCMLFRWCQVLLKDKSEACIDFERCAVVVGLRFIMIMFWYEIYSEENLTWSIIYKTLLSVKNVIFSFGNLTKKW